MSGTAPDISLSRIGQIAIVARDVARATRFYRDTLGMRFLFASPPGLAFFDCGGVRLMISLPEGPDSAAASSIIYYVVPDLQSAHQSLVSRGVTFESAPHLIAAMPDHDLWMAFLRDSEGNMVGLMSEVRR